MTQNTLRMIAVNPKSGALSDLMDWNRLLPPKDFSHKQTGYLIICKYNITTMIVESLKDNNFTLWTTGQHK